MTVHYTWEHKDTVLYLNRWYSEQPVHLWSLVQIFPGDYVVHGVEGVLREGMFAARWHFRLLDK